MITLKQRTGIKTKRGAMFGLDARIALAIFGALSVISGAALYSAIQESKTTAILTEMQEVAKAVEQYMLDTGVDPELIKNLTPAHIEDLVVEPSGVKGWKGPYLPFDVLNYDTLNSGKYHIYLRIVSNNDWSHPSNNGTADYCISNLGDPCYIWVLYRNPDGSNFTKSLLDSIDLKVDGSVDYTKGNVRISSNEIYLKAVPTLYKFK
jgi:type II secretory pathway pseudopilin PulG